MKRTLVLVALVGVSLYPSAVRAQRPNPRPPDGGSREVLISILIPSIPDSPFTATIATEWKRPLADGSNITLVNRRAIARDRAGRIFQERRLLVPPNDSQESIVTQIEISDPVAHTLYICVPGEHVCQVENFSAPAFVPPTSAGPPPGPGRTSPEETQDLGKQAISGLDTIGIRATSTIESGSIGNDNPLHITREYWYSPQLGVNLISKLQDPRFGTQTFEVVDIYQRDPDLVQFRVPPGSQIIDLRKSPSGR
jgi:hypothetical protein